MKTQCGFGPYWTRLESVRLHRTSNAHHLEKFFRNGHEKVLQAACLEGALDVGCGDGDLGFLFESLGYPVTAANYAPTNHTRTEGLRAADELNAADTNFSIFSAHGLRRLFERTKRELVEMFTTGDKVASDPVDSRAIESDLFVLRNGEGFRSRVGLRARAGNHRRVT